MSAFQDGSMAVRMRFWLAVSRTGSSYRSITVRSAFFISPVVARASVTPLIRKEDSGTLCSTWEMQSMPHLPTMAQVCHTCRVAMWNRTLCVRKSGGTPQAAIPKQLARPSI